MLSVSVYLIVMGDMKSTEDRLFGATVILFAITLKSTKEMLSVSVYFSLSWAT